MKSVQNSAPPVRRLVPQVRGKYSPNGHPAGAGNVGSARIAASGTPSGMPPTTAGSPAGTGDGVTTSRNASAIRSAIRIGNKAVLINDTALTYAASRRRRNQLRPNPFARRSRDLVQIT